ncbi:hypothetical protein H8695_07215 [Clostridiales bacterium BX7]|uniref:Uncharacterized protein n=2 Tax=Feifania hominis TaxID=2763660 RepID=A0A926DE70_9FIRM|nr:hypothetical protein [Feifania hominis]
MILPPQGRGFANTKATAKPNPSKANLRRFAMIEVTAKSLPPLLGAKARRVQSALFRWQTKDNKQQGRGFATPKGFAGPRPCFRNKRSNFMCACEKSYTYCNIYKSFNKIDLKTLAEIERFSQGTFLLWITAPIFFVFKTGALRVGGLAKPRLCGGEVFGTPNGEMLLSHVRK